jgi:prepilin-type processing-associated H-X9-DG protein
MHRGRPGLTLVELLVMIAIVVAVVLVAVPFVQQSREKSRRTQCIANLKLIGEALQKYSVKEGVYPPGRLGCGCSDRFPCEDLKVTQRQATSGLVMLLPYLDTPERPLLDTFKRLLSSPGAVYPPSADSRGVIPDDDYLHCQDSSVKSWKTAAVEQAMNERPPLLVCGSDRTTAATADRGSYAMCMGTKGPLVAKRSIEDVKYHNDGVFMYHVVFSPRDISDGLATTIFAGETVAGDTEPSANRWYLGTRLLDSMRSTEVPLNTPPGAWPTYDGSASMQSSNLGANGAFASRHPGGANFLFGDGNVNFLSENIDFTVYQGLSTRAGHKNVPIPEN